MRRSDAELVHQDLCAGVAGYVLEEEGRAASLVSSLAELGGAVGDLGHFEVGADGLADAAEFACFVELLDPFAKVGVGHGKLLMTTKNVLFLNSKSS